MSWEFETAVPITSKSSDFISIFRFHFRCKCYADAFFPKKIITTFFLYRAITCIYSQINGVACNAKKKIEGAFSRVSKPLEELKKASKKVTVSITMEAVSTGQRKITQKR